MKLKDTDLYYKNMSSSNYVFLYRTEKVMQFPENNIVSGVLPMSHAYGLFSLLQCLVLGHTYILIKRYTEKSFLSYIEKYQVWGKTQLSYRWILGKHELIPVALCLLQISTVYAVPTIALFLAKDKLIHEYDLSSVKLISCGGAPLRDELEENLKRRFNCPVLQHYGMTETTTMTLYSTPDNKPGTTGRLLPGMQAKVSSVEHFSQPISLSRKLSSTFSKRKLTRLLMERIQM